MEHYKELEIQAVMIGEKLFLSDLPQTQQQVY